MDDGHQREGGDGEPVLLTPSAEVQSQAVEDLDAKDDGDEQEAKCAQEIVYCLLDAKGSSSSTSTVQVAINSSVIQVARADAPLVVTSIFSFLENGQSTEAHQLGLVRLLCQVLETRRSDGGQEGCSMDRTLARNLTQHLVREVVKLTAEDARQQAILDVLVELAPMHPDIVLSGVLTMLDNSGNLPVAPTALVRILTEMAYNTPVVLEGRVHEVMGRYLTLLQASKTAEMKLLLYRAWCSLCVGMVNCDMASRSRGQQVEAAPVALALQDGFSLLVHTESTFSRTFGAAALELRRRESSAPGSTLAAEEPDYRRRASQALSSAFTILMSSWPSTKDLGTRAGAMETLGHLSLVIPKDQFLSNADALLELLVGLLSKQAAASTAFPSMTLMRGLCLFLQACIDADPEILLLENTLQTFISTLFTWIATNGPLQCLQGSCGAESFRSQAEILRCFEVLAETFCQELLDYFMSKTKGSRDDKLAALLVLRHLIGSGTWRPPAAVVLEGIQPLTVDTDQAVGLLLGELIVALAAADFLMVADPTSDAQPDAAGKSMAKIECVHSLLAFLINQTALEMLPEAEHSSSYSMVKLVAKNYQPADAPSSQEVRGRAGLVLGQLATSLKPTVRWVLWPMLLQAMVSPVMRAGLPVLCRTTSQIIQAVKASPDSAIQDLLLPLQPGRESNTQPEALLTWLLVCLHSPLESPGLGLSILRCLESLSGLIHPVLGEVWEAPSRRLQTLRSYLEENSVLGKFDADFWASAISQEVHFFLSALPEHDDLPSRLVDILQGLHLEVWRRDKDTSNLTDLQRAGLFNLMGVSLSHVTPVAKVQATLESLITHSNDLITDPAVRRACARGLGIVAQRHFELVVGALVKAAKTDAATKKAGSLSFFGKSQAVQQAEHLRAMLALALGHCAVFAPNMDVVLEQVREQILAPLLSALKQEKALAVLPSLVESVKLATDAIRKSPESAARRDPFLAQAAAAEPSEVSLASDPTARLAWGQLRDELVRALLPFILVPGEQADEQQAALFADLVCPSLEAMSSLIELPLDLPSDVYASILEAGLNVLIVSIPNDSSALRGESDDAMVQAGVDPLLLNRVQAVTQLIKSLLFHAHSWLGVSRLLQAVHAAGANCPVEFIRWTCTQILHTLCTVAPILAMPQADGELHSDVGDWCECLALLLPRTGDSCRAVVNQAIDAVQELLSRCEWTSDVHIVPLATKGDAATTADMSGVPKTGRASWPVEAVEGGSGPTPPSQQLVTALVSRLPPAAIPPLVQHLMPSMHDADSRAALSGVDALYLILQACSEKLSAERASNLITTVFEEVEKVSHNSVRQRVLSCIKVLALHHFESAVGELLDTGPDFNASILGALQVLAKEKALLLRLLNHFTDTLNNSDPGTQKRPNRLVLAATVALGHLFTVNDSCIGVVLKKYFPQLFGTFLLRIGTTTQGLSAQQTAAAFMNFLQASQNDSMAMALEGDRLSNVTRELYDEVISELAALFCRHHPNKREALLQFIHPFLDRPFPGHRVATASFLSQLLATGADTGLGDDIIASVVQSLLRCADDPHSVVRKQGVRGLNHLVILWQQNAAKALRADTDLVTQRVLPAICKGLPDENAAVQREAVVAVQRACQVPDASAEWQHLLLRSACHLQALLDAPDVALRGASLDLLGKLCDLVCPSDERPEDEIIMDGKDGIVLGRQTDDTIANGEDVLNFMRIAEILLVSCTVRLEDPYIAVSAAANRCLQKLVTLLQLQTSARGEGATSNNQLELEARDLLDRRVQEETGFEQFVFPFVQLVHCKERGALLTKRLELCCNYFAVITKVDDVDGSGTAALTMYSGDVGSSALSLKTCVAAGFMAAALVRCVQDTCLRPSSLLCSVCRDLMDLMVIEDPEFKAQLARILGFFDILTRPENSVSSEAVCAP